MSVFFYGTRNAIRLGKPLILRAGSMRLDRKRWRKTCVVGFAQIIRRFLILPEVADAVNMRFAKP